MAATRFKLSFVDKKKLLKEEEKEEGGEEEVSWQDMSPFNKIMFIIEFPLDWMRKVTMPVFIYIKNISHPKLSLRSMTNCSVLYGHSLVCYLPCGH